MTFEKSATLAYMPLFFCLVLFNACFHDSTGPNTTNDNGNGDGNADTRSFSDSELGVTILVPKDWKVNQDTLLQGLRLSLFGQKNPDISYFPNFNMIVLARSSRDSNLAVVMRQTEQEIRRASAEVDVLENKIVAIDGEECGEMVISALIGENRVKERLIFMLRNGKNALLTFAHTLDQFDAEADDFEFMRNSIRFQ